MSRCFLTLLVLALLQGLLPARAEGLRGEVSADDASVVQSSALKLPEKQGTNTTIEITATVKAEKAGTYFVVMGYTKKGKWLRGLLTKDEFWVVEKVTLKAGETKTIQRTPPEPPIGTKYWSVGIYKSLADMDKYR